MDKCFTNTRSLINVENYSDNLIYDNPLYESPTAVKSDPKPPNWNLFTKRSVTELNSSTNKKQRLYMNKKQQLKPITVFFKPNHCVKGIYFTCIIE